MRRKNQFPEMEVGRQCLRPAIPEIAVAAKHLDDAVSAHLSLQPKLAEELIDQANIPAIRDWAESLWGKTNPYNQYQLIAGAPPTLKAVQREKLRRPSSELKQLLHSRDGYHCRFCGIPVVRMEIRNRLRKLYPSVLPWAPWRTTNHAAFQAIWANYDHVLPHSRGGTSDLDNMVVVCAPCNFGRGNHTVEEARLADPRTREPVRSAWDGLERLLRSPEPSSAS